jgi:hypothetical protein
MSLLDLYQRRLRGEYSTGPHNDNTVGSTTLSEEQIKKATGKSGLEKFSPISQAQGIQKGDSQVPSANDHIGPEQKVIDRLFSDPVKTQQKEISSPQEPIRPEPREVQKITPQSVKKIAPKPPQVVTPQVAKLIPPRVKKITPKPPQVVTPQVAKRVAPPEVKKITPKPPQVVTPQPLQVAKPAPPPPQEPIRPAQVNLNSRQTIHGLKENLSSIDEKLSQMGSAELRRTRDYHELKHRKSEVQNRLDRFNR